MSEPDKLTQALDVLLDGVPKLIADAERYKRERDEAIQLLFAPDLGINATFLAKSDAFIARIEQADREADHATH